MSDVQEIKQVKAESLTHKCVAAMSAKGGEVVLGTYRFNTDDSTDLDYDDYEIAVTRAKLENHGWATDIAIRMDGKCRKVILSVYPPPESKTVIGVVVRK